MGISNIFFCIEQNKETQYWFKTTWRWVNDEILHFWGIYLFTPHRYIKNTWTVKSLDDSNASPLNFLTHFLQARSRGRLWGECLMTCACSDSAPSRCATQSIQMPFISINDLDWKGISVSLQVNDPIRSNLIVISAVVDH